MIAMKHRLDRKAASGAGPGVRMPDDILAVGGVLGVFDANHFGLLVVVGFEAEVSLTLKSNNLL